MVEQFKDNALSGQHTWPASCFMQALIECGGVPSVDGTLPLPPAEAERNVRRHKR